MWYAVVMPELLCFQLINSTAMREVSQIKADRRIFVLIAYRTLNRANPKIVIEPKEFVSLVMYEDRVFLLNVWRMFQGQGKIFLRILIL